VIVKEVALLGYAGPLPWQQHADGLHITLPAVPAGQYAYTFRILRRP
jgi:alpha-L-fucosidase